MESPAAQQADVAEPQLQRTRKPLPTLPTLPAAFKPLPSPPLAEDTIAEEPEEHDEAEEEYLRRSNKSPRLMHRAADVLVTPELSPDPLSLTPGWGPSPTRSHTAPGSPNSPAVPVSKLASLSLQPRNRSPYSRSHLRSRSTTSSPLLQPSITRSKSVSHVELPARVARPASPLARPSSPFGATPRRSSPLRRPLEESHSFSSVEIDLTISENKELDLKPRPSLSVETYDSPGAPSTPTTPVSPLVSHGTFPRMRRRPSSPLHVSLASPSRLLHTSTSSPALRSPASPAVDPAKFNESYPAAPSAAMSVASGSSMPSTPSSFRSRSPSISSLETIPDSPDAEEEAAAEADNDKDAIARLKAAVERNEGRSRGRSLGRTGDYFGSSGADKRKRWSVCGAERRSDLEMETIWED